MAIESEPALVPGILLSDMSIVEQGSQKRSLIGCFDQFTFQQFPAKYPRFFITAWMTNIQGSLSALELTTRIEEKGSAHVVFSSSMRVQFKEEKKIERERVMAMSIAVPGILFPKPGVYTIGLLIDGNEAGKRDILVLQRAEKKDK
jgi:hypothetical protein